MSDHWSWSPPGWLDFCFNVSQKGAEQQRGAPNAAKKSYVRQYCQKPTEGTRTYVQTQFFVNDLLYDSHQADEGVQMVLCFCRICILCETSLAIWAPPPLSSRPVQKGSNGSFPWLPIFTLKPVCRASWAYSWLTLHQETLAWMYLCWILLHS